MVGSESYFGKTIRLIAILIFLISFISIPPEAIGGRSFGGMCPCVCSVGCRRLYSSRIKLLASRYRNYSGAPDAPPPIILTKIAKTIPRNVQKRPTDPFYRAAGEGPLIPPNGAAL